MKAGIEKYMKT